MSCRTPSQKRLSLAAATLQKTSLQTDRIPPQTQPTIYELHTSPNESFPFKLDVTNQHIHDLKRLLLQLSTTITHDTQMKRLEWALSTPLHPTIFQNAGVLYDENGQDVNCMEVAREALWWFRQGKGWELPENVSLWSENEMDGKGKEERVRDTLEVHENLATQIYLLTGTKPRIVREDEKSIIYYS